ncbi:MAG TPA: helix-turn-helix domain-containing protein [Flavitalea sp.]|nr:helix-turn-helix domain-containing protein [Flavitalea sp.]HTF30515.1 helix-turn-helix domain-containing protein [Flavitalea sp.]
MKPHLLKVSLGPESSFEIRQNKGANFYNQWHFHPEIELIYIHKGRGTRFIGNNVSRFESDELLLIGSNLDHMWRCDPEYFLKGSKLIAEVTVIYFHRDFLGDKFFDSPELKSINSLLEKAKQGIKITGTSRFQVKDLITKLPEARGIDRIMTLLAILDKIAATKEKQFVNAMYNPIKFEEAEANRLNKIFHHTMTNFQNKITLTEIAAVANLSPKAFCRYFKSKTRKTYYNFLLEVRVTHACNLLLKKDMTVYGVCYESGFNNLSNFNRYFKKIMNKTPFGYKKEHLLLTE